MFNKSKQPEIINTNVLNEKIDMSKEFKDQALRDNLKKLGSVSNNENLFQIEKSSQIASLEKEIQKIKNEPKINEQHINKESIVIKEKLYKIYSDWTLEFFDKKLKGKKFKEIVPLIKESENIKILRVKKNKIDSNS